MTTSSIDPAQHKQLFLDDHAIESMSGVKRRLNPPRKRGPVLRPVLERGQNGLQSRSGPQWNPEKGLWEWWYNISHEVPPFGRRQDAEVRVKGYATSADGLVWDRPSLGLYEWRGSKDNNIADNPKGRRLYHILRDEVDSDSGRRYKGLFDSSDRYLAVSPDGFAWTMLDVRPIPSQDESHFLYDETTDEYLAFIKQPTEWGRSVWLSTSKDFATFTEPVLVFHTDEIDRENRRERVRKAVEDPDYLSPPLVDDIDHVAQCYQMAVMPYEGLYVGFPVILDPAAIIPPPHGNYTALNQVELTVSRDRLHWERVADRDLFIGIDTWDGVNYGTTQNLLCGRPVVREDLGEIWVYYNAVRFRGPRYLYSDIDDATFKDKGALSLATLRLDGFVSLDADDEGVVTTKPFTWRDGAVHVNVDTGGGELLAEVVDGGTREPLPGFSQGECEPLRGDHLNGRVTWRGAPAPPGDISVRLRITLRDAKLYAFWLGAG